jgi:hypothetical protein
LYAGGDHVFTPEKHAILVVKQTKAYRKKETFLLRLLHLIVGKRQAFIYRTGCARSLALLGTELCSGSLKQILLCLRQEETVACRVRAGQSADRRQTREATLRLIRKLDWTNVAHDLWL